MLVCHVIARPPRAAIAAVIAEIATANDAATIGQVVFATVVDDPASVRETVDAFLGQIQQESANAIDSVSAGSIYGSAIVTGANADSIADATQNSTIAVAEAASSMDGPDATIAGAVIIGARALSASRAGLGSVIASDSTKTQVISNVGAVI